MLNVMTKTMLSTQEMESINSRILPYIARDSRNPEELEKSMTKVYSSIGAVKETLGNDKASQAITELISSAMTSNEGVWKKSK